MQPKTTQSAEANIMRFVLNRAIFIPLLSISYASLGISKLPMNAILVPSRPS
jgi:hypothetical protein